MRYLALALALVTILWIPLARFLDHYYGVEGYEMRQLNAAADWPRLAEANGPSSDGDWLDDVYGTAVSHERRRYVFVSADRIVHTPQGHTLIQFDRGKGEEPLPSTRLRNLSLLAAAATGASTLLLVMIDAVRRRRRRRRSLAETQRPRSAPAG